MWGVKRRRINQKLWLTPKEGLFWSLFRVSGKTVEKMDLKFRTKFNYCSTYHSCLYEHDGMRQERPICLSKCSKWDFSIFKIFKNNMKFARAACWESKISKRSNRSPHSDILMCHYCWSLYPIIFEGLLFCRIPLPIQCMRLFFHK